LTGAGVLAGSALTLAGLLWRWSPGRPRPFLDAAGQVLAGSIAEKLRVKLNGVEQGMFIKGKDQANPVLLWVHGGPGMPDYFLGEQYPVGLEDLFTVVWWDQRGAGLSYRSDIPASTMTVEQFIADTLAVTDYLRERFDMGSVITGIFLPSWRFPEYTVGEKFHLWRGRAFSRSFGLWEQIIRVDLARTCRELDLPVYFFHGTYDFTCSYTLAAEYFRTLRAPLKGFYRFDGAAHSPILEQPELAREILTTDVLAGTNHRSYLK
jgi:pimeloyl-ACP methyl ester carboxylesterase